LAIPKSQVQFYLELISSLVRDDPLSLESKKHLLADLKTLVSRTDQEGLSFLTKTLPKLGKALDQGLLSSRFVRPLEFGNSAKSAVMPAFLQVYFNRVFNSDGVLLAEADPAAVKHLRQILFFAYKLETPYSEEQETRVVEAFKQAEMELEMGSDPYTTHLSEYVVSLTRIIFKDFNPKSIIPRHGPGAVATGERLEEKWTFRRLYSSIHRVYPYYEYFVVGSKDLLDRVRWYKALERHESGTAKVVLVPKDSRGPRLISCEPLEFQWIQQGLGRKLMNYLEEHSLTKGNINFIDQQVNRRLAQEGSVSQAWATIDLKEASDRVSLHLVRQAFQKVPDLLRALEACRTTETLLPSGEVLPLKKFAPMGSALCFPIEAYLFWAILVSAMQIKTKLPLKVVGERIKVYGDDIIVPNDWAPQCMLALERFALKVNRDKSCITGSFRESCGMDAFKGVDVTPSRLRKLWSSKPTDGIAFASYVSLANQMVSKGYRGTAALMWRELEQVYGRIPYGTARSSFPCYVVDDPETAEAMNAEVGFRVRFCDRYQRFEFKVKRIISRKGTSLLDGWTRLLRDVVVGGGDEPSTVVFPRSTQIRSGWSAV